MYSVILSKKLNNTELGLTGIHETYIYIPQELDVSNLFIKTNVKIRFLSNQNKKFYELRLTSDREKRIVGLGQYYRDFHVSAGDEITLERCVGQEENYYISLNKNPDSIVIQKIKHGFEVLTPERLERIPQRCVTKIDGKEHEFSLQFIESIQKRKDSPKVTNLYDLLVEETSWANRFVAGTLIELRLRGNIITMKEFYGWKKMVIGDIPNE